MADTKLKCMADREGFTKDTEYTVLAFGDAHCILRNDAGQIVPLGYATINDASAWEYPQPESKQDGAPVPTLANYVDKGATK